MAGKKNVRSVRISNRTLAKLVQHAISRGVIVEEMNVSEFIRTCLEAYASGIDFPLPTEQDSERILRNTFDRPLRERNAAKRIAL